MRPPPFVKAKMLKSKVVGIYLNILDMAYKIFISLLLLTCTTHASILIGSFNYHFDTSANSLYSGEVARNVHLSPIIGVDNTDIKSVLFLGVNSIHKPMMGGYYYNLDYCLVAGAYIQDTSLFRKRGIKFYVNSDVIPILGFNYQFKRAGILVSPVIMSVYFKM